MKARYIYKNSICGLEKNHEYEIKFSKKLKSYVYDCNVVKDLTTDTYIDKTIQFASEISIKNYFDIKVLRLED